MKGQEVRHGSLLQWSYPVILWLLVAFFTILACKNVMGTAWESTQRPCCSNLASYGTIAR